MGKECELQPPRLEYFDAWGQRVDNIQTCQGWKQLHDVAAEEGLISIAFGAFTSVNHTPSWMPPANPSTTMAPSMTPILKPSPLTQTPTLSPAYTQTVQIMKCSLGNNYLY